MIFKNIHSSKCKLRTEFASAVSELMRRDKDYFEFTILVCKEGSFTLLSELSFFNLMKIVNHDKTGII